MATAISKKNRRNRRMKVSEPHGLKLILSHTTQEQRRMRRCPASKLAPSRKPKVRGWIRSLAVSIRTIKGIRYEGVPPGTR
jgi:hypothetical protein